MSQIQLHLPAPAMITGILRDTSNAYALDQDMLQIELPGNVFIDVGWYPDCDPNGEYRLVVFRDDFDNQIEPPVQSKNVRDIKDAIDRLVAKYGALPPSPSKCRVSVTTSYSSRFQFFQSERFSQVTTPGSPYSFNEEAAAVA